jgi:hypothetical protein
VKIEAWMFLLIVTGLLFRNNKVIKSASKPLAVCKLTVGDMYSSILNFHREQIVQDETHMGQNISSSCDDLFNATEGRSPGPKGESHNSFVIPAPQEYSLIRSSKANTSSNLEMLDLIHQELTSIQMTEEERLRDDDADDFFVSPDSLFNIGKKANKDDTSGSASANEKLYGSISLSFFPVTW